jgi:hypothetical protein
MAVDPKIASRWSARSPAAAARWASTNSRWEGPEFFDRKVRAEQAAFGAEDRNGVGQDICDMRGIVAKDEGAKAKELCDDVPAFRKVRHAGAPGGAALRRQIFPHPCMLKDEGHLGTSFGKARSIRHLRCENLQIKTPAVVCKPRDVATDFCVSAEVRPRRKAVQRIFVRVQLHADAAYQRIFGKPVELWTNVIRAEISKGDDAVRPSMLVRGLLNPGRLVLEAVVGPVGLNINRFGHARACEIGEIFLDRIIAADRLIGPEDARLHRADQP